MEILSDPYFALAVNFAFGLVGAASHFYKGRFRGQTEAAVRDWLWSHPVAVLSALFFYCMAFVYGVKEGGFQSLTQSSMVAAWGLGYVMDSLMNKSDGDARVDVNVGER